MKSVAGCLIVAFFLFDSAPRTRLATISGVVTEDDSAARPIVRAVVTLAGSALRPSLKVVTDASGRFVFSDVPDGQFTLSAFKTTYLTMSYGQAVPGRGAGLPISVRDGRDVTGLTWKLPRAAVISGLVTDDRGQPMRDIPIVLMQWRASDGERVLEPAACCGWARTDSDGTYRAYGVPPGEYLVSAIPRGDYVYIPSGPWYSSDSARQIDPQEMQWALRQVGSAPALSNAVPVSATTAEPPAGPMMAYGRVYYPGTTDESAAVPVAVGRADERRGINFTMRLYRTGRIQGTIAGPDGQPVTNARVSLGGASVGPTGTFNYRSMGPGRYRITAMTTIPPLWGLLDVDMDGTDKLGLQLRLDPAPTIAGRVAFEASALTPPTDLARVRISFRPAVQGLLPSAAASDGTFKVPLSPGRYRMFASLAASPAAAAGGTGAAAPPSWTLKSITLNGQDIADTQFEARAGESITDVVITFTDRAAELSGVLLDAGNRPAPGLYVVAFSTNSGFWQQGSRRVPAPVRTATDGAFRFTGLLPGPYFVVALTSADAADLADPVYLKELARSAITVTLADGEKKTQDLRIGR